MGPLRTIALGVLFAWTPGAPVWAAPTDVPVVAMPPAPVVATKAVPAKRKARQARVPRRRIAVRAALKQVGVWYRWGGTTRRGFDCSGLMQYAWRQAGVRLPRVTYDQIRVGIRIASRARVRAGDLLFPGTGHVQMALGNGMVVEAARRGTRVRVRPMRGYYIAIRRPVR